MGWSEIPSLFVSWLPLLMAINIFTRDLTALQSDIFAHLPFQDYSTLTMTLTSSQEGNTIMYFAGILPSMIQTTDNLYSARTMKMLSCLSMWLSWKSSPGNCVYLIKPILNTAVGGKWLFPHMPQQFQVYTAVQNKEQQFTVLQLSKLSAVSVKAFAVKFRGILCVEHRLWHKAAPTVLLELWLTSFCYRCCCLFRQPQFHAYLKESRNLVRVRHAAGQEKSLKLGHLNILALLSSLPATQHDPLAFVVDVTLASVSFTYIVQRDCNAIQCFCQAISPCYETAELGMRSQLVILSCFETIPLMCLQKPFTKGHNRRKGHCTVVSPSSVTPLSNTSHML